MASCDRSSFLLGLNDIVHTQLFLSLVICQQTRGSLSHLLALVNRSAVNTGVQTQVGSLFSGHLNIYSGLKLFNMVILCLTSS